SKHLTTIKDLRNFAKALRITPSVYAGSAPWITMVTCGVRAESHESVRVECSSFLTQEHPLNWDRKDEDLAQLAASLGRPDLALQLEASRIPSAERVRH